jgi:hypothetical protein
MRDFREMSLHGQCADTISQRQVLQSPALSFFFSGKVYIFRNLYIELRPPAISYRPLNSCVYIEMRKFTVWQ